MKRQGQGGGELTQGGGQPRVPPLPSGTEPWPLHLPQLPGQLSRPLPGVIELATPCGRGGDRAGASNCQDRAPGPCSGTEIAAASPPSVLRVTLGPPRGLRTRVEGCGQVQGECPDCRAPRPL